MKARRLIGFYTPMERRKKLWRELQRLLPLLQEMEVKKVILIGSLATGGVRSTSDIDLIVIKETEKPFLGRLEEYYQQLLPETCINQIHVKHPGKKNYAANISTAIGRYWFNFL